jgi:hypothetical protein
MNTVPNTTATRPVLKIVSDEGKFKAMDLTGQEIPVEKSVDISGWNDRGKRGESVIILAKVDKDPIAHLYSSLTKDECPCIFINKIDAPEERLTVEGLAKKIGMEESLFVKLLKSLSTVS